MKYLIATAAFAAIAAPAAAQDTDEGDSRTRVVVGPQLKPSFPGSDKVSLSPFVDVARASDGEYFDYVAPDQSFGIELLESNGFSIGPSVGLKGSRSESDTDGLLPKVNFTVEVGAYAQYEASENLRLRAEVRQAVNGHDGLFSVLSADYIIRDGDDQLFSIGPRVTVTDSNYQESYFSVTPEQAAASPLTAYDADGGVQAVGGAVSYLKQFTPRWGIYSYARYERLVGDAADSPVVLQLGSRDQYSGGLALSYTFGSGVR